MANADVPSTPNPPPDDLVKQDVQPERPSIFEQRWPRLALVLVIALGIVGVTAIVGRQAGWSSIGSGGVNAQLLPKVGEPAPDFFTVTSNGEPVLLSTLKGQPVWINFWGSWCEPCQAEFPAVEAAYQKLNPQGLIMLGVSQREDVSQSVQYAQAAGGTFPILVDPTRMWAGLDTSQMSPEVLEVAKGTLSWQVNNFPTHIFIDRNGIVQAVVIKPMTEEEAVANGEKILGIPYTGPALPPISTPVAPVGTPEATPEGTPIP